MFYLQPDDPFPDPRLANKDGLLAIGAQLSPERVFNAHSEGIFPWYESDDLLLWWSPAHRGILKCTHVHQSRSLRRKMRQLNYQFSVDQAFDDVVGLCQQIHGKTWITTGIRQTYLALHKQGRAHSFELWHQGILAGGLYGVGLDRVFCAESMFSCIPNASKIVLVRLCSLLLQHGYTTIDCQFVTPHLETMGAIEITREEYLTLLKGKPDRMRGNWSKLATPS